ncbi:MAG: hypothetical protein Q7U91_05850 [Sideroxyarcus sp.]|nr:hypothetical protein [Sideroxyarcus sp.]
MDHIKFYIKIASTSLLRWLALSGIGLVLSIIGIAVGLMLLGNNTEVGYHGVRAGNMAGVFLGILTLFQDDPWPALLLVCSFMLVAIYILLASRISLGFVLFQLSKNSIFPIIGDKVSSLLNAIIVKQPGLAQTLNSVSSLRDRLINSANMDSTLNKVQRKVIFFGLKKCRLDDIDFQQPNLDLPALISNKVVQALQEAARPSYWPLLVVVVAHTTLLVLALAFERG